MTLEARERSLVDLSLATLRGDKGAVDRSIRAGRASGLERAAFEEALLQGALYFGFPRALSAFQGLQATWPLTGRCSHHRTTVPVDERARGEALFAEIYGSKNDTVRSMLQGLNPDLEAFVIECAYGRILARPQMSLLRREICATAVLAAMGQEPQLIGHARAALRLGLEDAQCAWILERAVADADAREQMLRSIRGSR